MVYVKKKRVLGKAPVKNKNKNKNKNTNTQISTQNQNVHIHLSEKTKRAPRTTKPKPKPKDDLSPYELMVYRNTHLQPTYSYNLPLNEKLNVQTPDYTKQLENILLEFRTNNTRQPMVVESKNESDEEKFKRFNEAKYKHYDELQKNDKSKTTKEKKKMIFDYIQNATPIKDDISHSQHKTDDLIEATVKKKLGRPMNPRPINPTPKQPVGRPRKPLPINPTPKQPVGRPRKPLPINPMPKKARGRPRKNYIIGQAEEEED